MADDDADQSWVPRPDPTLLTTEQLIREITRVQILIESKSAGLRELSDEKFASINKQFELIERQRVELKTDTAAAVAAALAAAKEAVREQKDAQEKASLKTETGNNERIGQLSRTIETAFAGNADAVADLKNRVGRLENVRQGAQEQRQEARSVTASQGQWIGVGMAILGVAIAVAALLIGL